MYRALIVEDEDIMRDYLAENLHSFCPAWMAAATAADGMEAVERMAHERFDAVITDIRMPALDGLALSRYIRSQDADMPILILSGYDAFDYARSAMRLNVFDYLLKPLNEQELSAALYAMAAQVDARREHIGSDLLLRALSGDADASEALSAMLNAQSSALLLIAQAVTEAQSVDSLYQAAAGLGVLSTRLPDAIAVCLTASDALILPTVALRAIERLALKHSAPVRCGCVVLSPSRAKEAYTEASALLWYAQALDIPFLMEPLQHEHRTAIQKLNTMQTLLHQALAEHALTDERCAILSKALLEFSPHQARFVAAALLAETSGTVDGTHFDFPALPDASPEAVANWFASALQRLRKVLSPPEAVPGQLVRRARDFLRVNFAQSISLSSLADQLQVTPAYLSAQFHREMNCSYSQYLLRLRMEEAARKLLEDADVKVHDVSRAVGFVSPKHFSHVFREYYQMTPKDYRDRSANRIS